MSDLKLPAVPVEPDVVDRIAAEIGLQVGHHIETMYPAMTKSVAWDSAKKSIQGLIRNAVASAGRAAERGEIDYWIARNKKHRREINRMRNAADDIPW
jgi:hypothetical protein